LVIGELNQFDEVPSETWRWLIEINPLSKIVEYYHKHFNVREIIIEG
jgi:hypothetical protein